MSHRKRVRLECNGAAVENPMSVTGAVQCCVNSHCFRSVHVVAYADRSVFTYCGVLEATVYKNTPETIIAFLMSPMDAAAMEHSPDSVEFLPTHTVAERCMVCLIATLKVINRTAATRKSTLRWAAAATPQPLMAATFEFQAAGGGHMTASIPRTPLSDVIGRIHLNAFGEFERRGLGNLRRVWEHTKRLTCGGEFAMLDDFEFVYVKNRLSRITSPCICITFENSGAVLNNFFYYAKETGQKKRLESLLANFYSRAPFVTRAMLLVLELVKWGMCTQKKTSCVLRLYDLWHTQRAGDTFDSDDLAKDGLARHRYGYYTRFGFWPLMPTDLCRDVFCAWSGSDELNYFNVLY